MKNALFLLVSLLWIGCFSQKISVTTNTYTIPDLVTKVLVNKLCVPVSSISWKTGNTNGFGSTNGIGYFENTNPNFPLEKGVILSTGDVLKSAGPNNSILNDGNDLWPGDTDLEATLTEAGISMKSTNASVLEFDFVPFSPNFEFQFLFASEEYGNFQCQFSDAFAFLLTNKLTGKTTNLAVVPNTTNPISVVTIRDFLYNSSCPSVNEKYFGSFNGGSAAANSATNFNGQTVLMNATSTSLIPNNPYHIKLVIADRKDYQADSAIFLGANSFNVGQDVLGPDLTISNNTAICLNESYSLNSNLDPKTYSFAWTLNGKQIGGNTPSLTITKEGTYGLTYTIKSTGCIVTTDFIKIEYYKDTTPNPINLYKCNTNQPNYTFDLSLNNTVIKLPSTQINYYSSSNDAKSNTNILPLIYNINQTSLPATIWVRIVNPISQCISFKSFKLDLIPPPVANKPEDLNSCENIVGSKTAFFDLLPQITKILGNQSSNFYSVTYYLTANDAITRKKPLSSSGGFVTKSTTIYVRIQNITDIDCYSTTSFNLNVFPRPKPDSLPNQFVCDSFTLPELINGGVYYSSPNKGLPLLNPGDIITKDMNIYIYNETNGNTNCFVESNFQIKILTPTEMSPSTINTCDAYLLPIKPYNLRYYTKPGGPNGGGTELIAGRTLIDSPGLNTVYTYFASTDIIPCVLEGQLNINVEHLNQITDVFPNVFECTSYNLPPLKTGNYYTYNAITKKYTLAVSPITKTTKLYVYDKTKNCKTDDIIFTVYIGSIGLTNVNECKSYYLPPAPIGEYRDAPNGGGNLIQPGLLVKSTQVYIHINSHDNSKCIVNDSFKINIDAPYLTTPINVVANENFILPTQTEGADYYTMPGGPSTMGNVKLIPNVTTLTKNTTVYLYKVSTKNASCYTEIAWQITINNKPKIDSRANILQCDDYVLTPLENGKYYSEPNGVGPIPFGTIIKEKNKTIYIYAVNPNDPSLFSENSFEITINGAKADPIPSQLTYCDSFTFPPLPSPKNYYYDAPEGPHGVGKIIPFGTTVTKATVLPKYYIFYETGDRLNCTDEKSFSITIANKPIANAVNTLETCDALGPNDGISVFNLTTSDIRNQVLRNHTSDSNIELSFFTSLEEANNPNAITLKNPEKYENRIAYEDTVWIRVATNSIPNPCFDVVALKLKVNAVPTVNLKNEYSICQDHKTGVILNPAFLNTGLPQSKYTFEWFVDNQLISGNTSSITALKKGIYTVKVTDKTTYCSTIATTKVVANAPYIEINYSEAFENPTYIKINVLGTNSVNFEYKIDNSPFQESPNFTNISAGEHTIYVRDTDSLCAPAPINAIIINYPKYFTPNGDGFNDTWNIDHLEDLSPNAVISIYDRYGKMITQITPSTEGWNGLFNGQTLPASDYWFTVNFTKNNVEKTFKSHFSLKR